MFYYLYDTVTKEVGKGTNEKAYNKLLNSSQRVYLGFKHESDFNLKSKVLHGIVELLIDVYNNTGLKEGDVNIRMTNSNNN